MQRTIKLTKLCSLAALVAAALLLISLVAEAAVSLSGFEATSADDGQSVTVEWETGTEDAAAQFYIHRSDPSDPVPSEDNIDITDESIITINGTNDKFIIAQGDTSSGASYSIVDENVEEDETYRYMLVELEINGSYKVYPGFASTVTVTEREEDVGIGGGDPTETPEPDEPTATPEPEETVTEEPTEEPTEEATEEPDEEEPTATPEPEDEETPEPTETPDPDEEETPEPTPTSEEDAASGSDDPTATPEPAATVTPEATTTPAIQLQATATQTPPPTNTPAPTATLVVTEAASEDAPPTAAPDNEEAASGQERVENDSVDDSVDDSDEVVVEEVSAETATDSITGVGVAEAAEEAYPVAEQPVQGDDDQPTGLITPPEETDTTQAGNEASYPGDNNQQESLLIDSNTNSTQQIGSTDPVIGDNGNTTIGGSSGDTGSLAPPLQAEPDDEGGSTPLLWLVFAAGILVFIAGVAGSILIFTRQREDSA